MRSPRAGLAAVASGLAALALAQLGLASCGGGSDEGESEPNPARRELLEITLLEPPTDSNQGSLFRTPGPSVRDVIRAIDEARTDAHVTGLFLRLGPMGSAWGRIDDLREALARVREAHKPVHCHVETLDNAGYVLAASACDRLTITPAGTLDVVGVGAHLFYARSLLTSLGLEADILQVGAFKGAAEPFTRDDVSPETRESMGALLDDLHALLVEAMVEGRHLPASEVQAVIDGGPYDSSDSQRLQLVDDVEFDDEAIQHAREASGATRERRAILVPAPEPVTLSSLLGALGGETQSDEVEGPRIVVAYLEGGITDDESEGAGSGQAGPFVRAMRELADDDDVRAVVLRIDSPGGSALASDRMWHAVSRVAARKPVVVSVGDTCASGGYYVASAAHEIVVHDGSIVGSIGVVGGKVSLAGLFDEIGVHVETMTRGANAGWTSPAGRFSDGERAALQRMMSSTYQRFVRRVDAGRGLDEAGVLAVAEGRIWSGRDAIERGLADREGGLVMALARARERASVEESVPVVEWPPRRSPLDVLARSMGAGGEGEALAQGARTVLVSELPGPFARAWTFGSSLRGGEHVVLAAPWVVEIR